MSDLKFQFFVQDSPVAKLAFEGTQRVTRSIGKSGADILIDANDVSRIHAQLIYDGEYVYILDSGSTNGTFLNGKKLGTEPVQLNVNDIVMFSGSGAAKMCVLPKNDGKVSINTGIKEVSSLLKYLENKDQITIGRSPDCDVVLSHSSISRVHARVKKLGGGKFQISDEGSMNGTFVNGKKVSSAEITGEDKIFVGRFQLSLKGSGVDLSAASAIRAVGVQKKYGNGFLALHETTFDIPSGGVVAIMGPSGCGKSTLLKVLNGDSPATAGNVFINGLDLISNYPYLKTQIGYVPQDDIVHRELTVEQSLYYAAKIRLEGITDEQVKEKSDQLLAELNITHIRNNLVSAISGGQRKRVSIAVELLSDPTILFLDEPTSPLDPQTIEEFLGILRNLARKGTSIIMVTHKPEDLMHMDTVMFMAEGGHMVYFGAADKYKEFFHVKSTVEVYENISGPKAKQWIKSGSGASTTSGVTAPKQKEKTTSVNPFRQFFWLQARYFKIKTNDKLNSAIMIAQAPIIAGLLCMIFQEVRLAVLFLTAVSAIWFGVNNAAREIVGEAPIYKRERMFNVLIIPYIFSKVTVLGMFALVQCILFNLMLSLRYHGEAGWNDPVMGTAWMFFLTITSSFFGLLISATSSSSEKVMSIVPIAIIPQIMLAGTVAKIRFAGVEFLSYLTYSRWGTEGFTHIQGKVREEVPVVDTARVKFDPEHALSMANRDTSGYQMLKRNFHNESYVATFKSWTGTLHLDLIAVSFLTVVCLLGIWIALRKKDSIA